MLVCTDTYPPQVNGASVVTELTVRGLRARGWTCGVVAPRTPKPSSLSPWSEAPPPVETLPSIPLPHYPEVRVALPLRSRVRRAIETFRPDLVHAPTEFIIGQLAVAEARRAGIPYCTSYHTDFDRYADAYGVPWLRGPVRRWLRRFHGGARRIFTPSLTAREDLRRLGLDAVEVWGRGVEDDLFHPRHRSTGPRLRWHLGSAFTFLYVGRLAPEKSVDVVLRAFAQLRTTVPSGSVRLLIAGGGPAERDLRAIAGPDVTFVGTLHREQDLPVLYASADAFVFASQTETLGLVILEAMASGLPVIATPAGGVAEHLIPGENGLVFEPGDIFGCARRMRELVTDRALLERLRSGARQSAVRRSWTAELDHLDGVYRSLVCEARASAGSGLCGVTAPSERSPVAPRGAAAVSSV